MIEEREQIVIIPVTNTETGVLTVETVQDRGSDNINSGLAIEERREHEGPSASNFGQYETGTPIKVDEEE